jgi:calcineurin-like phosphoesterase family protein
MKDYKNIWFTSDHHFFHRNIAKYTGRPWESIVVMNDVMVKRWNEVVGKDDLVYHLGDFIFGGKELIKIYANQLNGDKILIKGNHDKNVNRFLDAGFLEVHDRIDLTIAGRNVIVCHYPYWNEDEPNIKYRERRPIDKGDWLIHGHVHEKWKIKGKMINVSVEQWDYYPVHLETIIDIIEERER